MELSIWVRQELTIPTGRAGSTCWLPTPGLLDSPQLSIMKLDGPDPVDAGTTLTYTLVVTNASPGHCQCWSR